MDVQKAFSNVLIMKYKRKYVQIEWLIQLSDGVYTDRLLSNQMIANHVYIYIYIYIYIYVCVCVCVCEISPAIFKKHSKKT